MTQGALLNTRTMASTREMRARIRARRAMVEASNSRRSETTAEKKSPAAPVAAPASSPMRSRAPLQEMEFNPPDENRTYPLLSNRLAPCPRCSGRPELVRAGDYLGMFYRVECERHCGETTPPLKSSADAVRHWQLAARLSKL